MAAETKRPAAQSRPSAGSPTPDEGDPGNKEISHAQAVKADGPHRPGTCVICDAGGDRP